MDLLLGNGEQLPVEDETFDGVFHVGGINFFNDKKSAIDEMIRVAKSGARILIADDLLATGGTMAAVVDMVESMGGELVECCFMAELEFLHGREKLPAGKAYSLLKF